jgi:hypothetical protein
VAGRAGHVGTRQEAFACPSAGSSRDAAVGRRDIANHRESPSGSAGKRTVYEDPEKEGFTIVILHPRIIRSTLACLMLAVGLGGMAGGCGGGASGPGTGPGVEKVPEGIEKLKESMKERASAKKGRPGRAPGGQ